MIEAEIYLEARSWVNQDLVEESFRDDFWDALESWTFNWTTASIKPADSKAR